MEFLAHYHKEPAEDSQSPGSEVIIPLSGDDQWF